MRVDKVGLSSDGRPKYALRLNRSETTTGKVQTLALGAERDPQTLARFWREELVLLWKYGRFAEAAKLQKRLSTLEEILKSEKVASSAKLPPPPDHKRVGLAQRKSGSGRGRGRPSGKGGLGETSR